MSLATQFIKAAIRDGDTASFRQSSHAIYLETELPLYEYCLRHFSNHRVLPDEEVLRGQGFNLDLPSPNQPSTYYLERMKHRLIFNVLSENLETVSQAMSTQDMESAVTILRDTLARVGSLTETNTASMLDDILDEVRADYDVAKHTFGLRGITLGYDTLDATTLGAMGGDLIVVAGRPGAGKTSALLKMAHAAHRDSHRDVLFVSMEMPKLQIARRYLGLATGLNPNYMRGGELSQWGEQIMDEGIASIKDSPHKLYLESGDFEGSVAGVESMVQQFSPEALYVDAAYLLTPEGQRKGYVSKWESLAEVVKQLKRIAINYGIPVFISVQFNRNQKDKSTNSPDLSDIAGTDSIPQDASIVLGIQKPPAPYSETRRFMKMMKNREGDLTTILYNYLFNPVNFDELPYVEEDEEGETERAQPLNTDWMV